LREFHRTILADCQGGILTPPFRRIIVFLFAQMPSHSAELKQIFLLLLLLARISTPPVYTPLKAKKPPHLSVSPFSFFVPRSEGDLFPSLLLFSASFTRESPSFFLGQLLTVAVSFFLTGLWGSAFNSFTMRSFGFSCVGYFVATFLLKFLLLT